MVEVGDCVEIISEFPGIECFIDFVTPCSIKDFCYVKNKFKGCFKLQLAIFHWRRATRFVLKWITHSSYTMS